MRSFWGAVTRFFLWPIAFGVSHGVIELWQFFSPNYVPISMWVANWIYGPFMHKPFVFVVTTVVSMFGSPGQWAATHLGTYFGNKPPTYLDAAKVYFTFMTPIIVWILFLICVAGKWVGVKMFSRYEPHEEIPPRRRLLDRRKKK
jgi:hypothetical protein